VVVFLFRWQTKYNATNAQTSALFALMQCLFLEFPSFNRAKAHLGSKSLVVFDVCPVCT
jgi:hypothetical protein